MGFGKDGKGQIIYDSNRQDLAALAANDAVLLPGRNATNMVDDFRIIKMDYWIGIFPATGITVLNGPIMFGVADGELTAAQIEAALEGTVLNASDTDLETSMRAVWPLEIFMLPDPNGGTGSDPLVRSGSKNLRWTFHNPGGWTYWVYNMSAFALTTGSVIDVITKNFGVWVS